MENNSKKNRLSGLDRVNYICAVIAGLPFHVLLMYSLQVDGVYGKTFLYIIINGVILFAMFRLLKFLYKETDNRIIVKKIFIYQIIPIIILFIVLFHGRNFKVGQFNSIQEYMDNYMISDDE